MISPWIPTRHEYTIGNDNKEKWHLPATSTRTRRATTRPLLFPATHSYNPSSLNRFSRRLRWTMRRKNSDPFWKICIRRSRSRNSPFFFHRNSKGPNVLLVTTEQLRSKGDFFSTITWCGAFTIAISGCVVFSGQPPEKTQKHKNITEKHKATGYLVFTSCQPWRPRHLSSWNSVHHSLSTCDTPPFIRRGWGKKWAMQQERKIRAGTTDGSKKSYYIPTCLRHEQELFNYSRISADKLFTCCNSATVYTGIW